MNMENARTRNLRHLLGAAILCLPFGYCGQAAAQASTGADNSPAEDAGQGAGEIVVTAQRRSERLIDVPAAVSVVGADMIGGAAITNTKEIGQLVPGLQISNNGGFTVVSVRGISSETAGPGADNNVAIYLDGVYLPSKSAGVFEFPDIETIQVLKGPQGTLYGRNATGGAILLKTSDPKFTPAAFGEVGFGSFGERELKGIVGGGIVDDLIAVQAVGYYKEYQGYLRSLIPGRKIGGVESALIRGKVLFTPSPSIRMLLSVYHSDRTDRDAMAFTSLNGNTVGVMFDPDAIVASSYRYNAANYPNEIHNKTTGVALVSQVDLGFGDLSLVTGYTNLKNYIVTDGDNTSAVGVDYITNQPQKTFSQEVNLSSRVSSSLKILAGLSYVKDTGYFDPVGIYAGGASVVDIYSRMDTKAFGAYLEADFAASDRLNLTAGVRYSSEWKELRGAFGDRSFPFVAKKNWSNVSPRFAARFTVSDDLNVYASYTKGFKSGQLNPTALFTAEPVDPELVRALELGLKSKISGGLSMNVSAFHYSYDKIQVTTWRSSTQALQNAAKGEVYGADIDLMWRPDDDLSFVVGAAYTHAEYKDFKNAVVVVPIPSASCPPGRTYCGNQNAIADLTGNTLPRAPRFTLSASASYTHHLGQQRFIFSGNVYYTSKFFWEAGNRVAQDAYAIANAKVQWVINDGPVAISAWVKNATGVQYYNSAAIGLDADGVLSAAPRSVGGSLSVRF